MEAVQDKGDSAEKQEAGFVQYYSQFFLGWIVGSGILFLLGLLLFVIVQGRRRDSKDLYLPAHRTHQDNEQSDQSKRQSSKRDTLPYRSPLHRERFRQDLHLNSSREQIIPMRKSSEEESKEQKSPDDDCKEGVRPGQSEILQSVPLFSPDEKKNAQREPDNLYSNVERIKEEAIMPESVAQVHAMKPPRSHTRVPSMQKNSASQGNESVSTVCEEFIVPEKVNVAYQHRPPPPPVPPKPRISNRSSSRTSNRSSTSSRTSLVNPEPEPIVPEVSNRRHPVPAPRVRRTSAPPERRMPGSISPDAHQDPVYDDVIVPEHVSRAQVSPRHRQTKPRRIESTDVSFQRNQLTDHQNTSNNRCPVHAQQSPEKTESELSRLTSPVQNKLEQNEELYQCSFCDDPSIRESSHPPEPSDKNLKDKDIKPKQPESSAVPPKPKRKGSQKSLNRFVSPYGKNINNKPGSNRVKFS